MDTDIADISAPHQPPLPEGEPAPSPNLERTGLSMEFELLLEQLVNLHLSEVAQGTQQTSQYFTAATRLILQFFCSWQPVLRCVWFFRCLNCFLRKQFFDSMWWVIPKFGSTPKKKSSVILFWGVMSFLCCMFPARSTSRIFRPVQAAAVAFVIWEVHEAVQHRVKDNRLVKQGTKSVSIQLTQSKSCLHGKHQNLAVPSMKKSKSPSLHEIQNLSLGCTRLHETHFFKHIFASRWQHAKMCQFFLNTNIEWLFECVCVCESNSVSKRCNLLLLIRIPFPWWIGLTCPIFSSAGGHRKPIELCPTKLSMVSSGYQGWSPWRTCIEKTVDKLLHCVVSQHHH